MKGFALLVVMFLAFTAVFVEGWLEFKSVS